MNISFQMDGEHGLLEIADNRTNEVLWSNSWNEKNDPNEFSISLTSLKSENEYVIRFTGTKITYAKIVITSDSSLVKER